MKIVYKLLATLHIITKADYRLLMSNLFIEYVDFDNDNPTNWVNE